MAYPFAVMLALFGLSLSTGTGESSGGVSTVHARLGETQDSSNTILLKERPAASELLLLRTVCAGTDMELVIENHGLKPSRVVSARRGADRIEPEDARLADLRRFLDQHRAVYFAGSTCASAKTLTIALTALKMHPEPGEHDDVLQAIELHFGGQETD